MAYPLLDSSCKTSPGQGTNWSAPGGNKLPPCRGSESLPSAHSDKPQTHGTAAEVNLMMISGVFGSPRIVPNRNNGKWKSSRILHLFAINYRCPFQTLYDGTGVGLTIVREVSTTQQNWSSSLVNRGLLWGGTIYKLICKVRSISVPCLNLICHKKLYGQYLIYYTCTVRKTCWFPSHYAI